MMEKFFILNAMSGTINFIGEFQDWEAASEYVDQHQPDCVWIMGEVSAKESFAALSEALK
jgi:hypothetical protein